jgi:hypothetical protein
MHENNQPEIPNIRQLIDEAEDSTGIVPCDLFLCGVLAPLSLADSYGELGDSGRDLCVMLGPEARASMLAIAARLQFEMSDALRGILMRARFVPRA